MLGEIIVALWHGQQRPFALKLSTVRGDEVTHGLSFGSFSILHIQIMRGFYRPEKPWRYFKLLR